MPNIPISWSDNTKELQANLIAGMNTIEATRASVDKLVQSFQGDRIAASAQKWVLAINEIGGATKLTADEQDRASAVLDKYIEKQEALGNTVPDAVSALNDQIKALQAARETTESTTASTSTMSDAFGALKEAIESPTAAAQSFASEFGASVLGPLGEFGAVAAGAVAAAGAIGAGLVELAVSARETASAIYQISEVTGMSVGSVSDLKFAIESAGGSLDQINGALFQFDQRMENNASKVDAGLKMIGLSLGQIRDMSMDQRLMAISDALRSAGDETNKAAVAMDIFGRQGRDLLPLLLKPLSDLNDQAKALGLTMSTEDAKAAEAFEVSLNSLKAQTSATWSALGLHVSLADEFTYAYDRMKLAIANVTYAFASTVTALVTLNQYLPALIQTINGSIGALPAVSGSAKKGVDDLEKSVTALDFKPVSLSGAELNRVEQDLTKSAEALIKEHEKEAAALQKYNDNLAAVSLTAQGFGVIVDTIDGSIVEATKYYVDHGVSLQKVGEMYGLTTVQVQALGEQFKFEQQVATDTAKAIDKYTESHQLALPTVAGLSDDARLLSAGLDDESRAAHQAEVEQNQLNDILKEQITTRNTLNDAIAKQNIALPGGSSGSQIDASGDSIFSGLSTDFAKAVASFAPILGHSLESGGSLGKAVESFGVKMGSMVGANLGTSLLSSLGSLAGPIGSLIGSLVSPLVTALFNIGGPSKEELAGRQTESQFESQFGGFDDMMAKVQAAYIATGKTAQQANNDVQAMFAAEKQGAAATAAAVAKINDVLTQQANLAQNAATATAGIGGFLGVNTGAMDTQAKDQTQLSSLNQQLAGETPGSSKYDSIKQQIDQLNQDLANQAAIVDATAVKTQDDASAMGAAVVGAFDEAIQGGMSFTDALKQNQPAIEALRAELDKAGLDGGAAFNLLSQQIDLIKDPIAGPVLTAVQNLAAGFKGLAASGTETAQDFQGFGDQVKQAFNNLVAQGKSAPEIMVAMQGPLQELWQEEQQYGFTLDDATQALLDQAVATGEVGEAHKTTSEQMLDAENKLVDVMTAMATAMGVTFPHAVASGTNEARQSIDGLKSDINSLPTSKTLTVTTDYQTEGAPPSSDAQGAATGGLVGIGRILPFPVAAMAVGGVVPSADDLPRARYFSMGIANFVPQGTDTVPAMLTPGEIVANEMQQGRVGRSLETADSLGKTMIGLIQQLQQGASAASAGTPAAPMQIQLVLNRKVLSEATIDALRVDEGGIRKVVKKVANG